MTASEYKSLMKKGKNKYHAEKTTFDGITFDSKREAYRYLELRVLEKAGKIKKLETQKPYELIPAQWETIETGEVYKTGIKKGQVKTKRVCIEQSVVYIADFVYEENGKTVVEDAKGKRLPEYIIKRKLMLWVHGIRIREV